MKKRSLRALSLIISLIIISLCFLPAFASGGERYRPYDNSEYFETGDYAIHYRVFPAQGEKKGRILFIHGFLCSTFAWRNMIPLFQQRGYECVAVDLPDFGYSTRESGDMEITDREDILISLMDELAPGEKWIIAGHSMGGGVAVNIAQRVDAKALLLYCPCPQSEFPQSIKPLMTSRAMEKTMDVFFTLGTKVSPLVRLVIAAAVMDAKFALTYDVSGVTDPVGYDGFGSGLCEMMFTVKATDLENAASISCPVLLVNASRDIILNSSQKQQMADSLPQAEKYTVEGGGHQCIENRAGEIAGISLDFLEK